MINVVSIEVNSATLRMAEDGLRALTDAIGPMMMGYSKGDANQKKRGRGSAYGGKILRNRIGSMSFVCRLSREA